MNDWIWGVIVLVAYLAVIMYIAYRSYGASDHSLDDHFVAKRGFGIVVLTLTYAATFHSAYAFTGIVGFAYDDGVGFWVNGLYLIPPAFLFWHFGKRLWLLGKRYNFLTLGDYLTHVYDNRFVGLSTAAVHTLFTAPYVAIQLTGSGYIFHTLTDGRIPFAAGAAVMLVVMLAYVLIGGIRAVAWTDTVQGAMMFVVIFAGGLYVVREDGGNFAATFERLHAQLPEWFSLPGPEGAITQMHWITLWIPLTLGLVLAPQIVIRIFSARSLRVLKWSAIGGAVYLVAIYMFVPGVAAVGRLAGGDIVADQLFVDQLWTNLPVLLAAVGLAGGIAASMSTADSQIHAVSATLAVDGYQKFVDKSRDPVRTKRFTYVTHGVIGIAAYIVVITDDRALIQLLAVALSGVGILAPVTIGALYWRRGTAVGGLVSIIGGFVTLILTTPAMWDNLLWNVAWWQGSVLEDPFGLGVTPGMWGLLAATAGFLVGSAFGRPATALSETQRFTTDYLRRAVDPQARARKESAGMPG